MLANNVIFPLAALSCAVLQVVSGNDSVKSSVTFQTVCIKDPDYGFQCFDDADQSTYPPFANDPSFQGDCSQTFPGLGSAAGGRSTPASI
ncbi:hypothetical protein VTP01DRAFT_1487 [Rhizomucor pusillus]|uniref:uncharacterized protein n=1 Tax=Rhizomucor pusillus TaxID=4840 RepID=UPI0037425CF5